MSNRSSPSVPPKRSPRARVTALLGGLTLAAAGSLWAAPAAYDVAATTPHSKPVEWALRRGMEASVESHARDVSIPSGIDLRDPALAEGAIGHYSVACAQCHAAPGHPAAPWMVLYPPPADLTQPEVVAQWSDAELYWIIKHGIKDTGMLALGPTHQERDLWAVAAFVRQLPQMSGERYHELVTRYQAIRAGMAAAPVHH